MNTRPAPPDLEFRAPDCPFCNRELSCDGDSFWCETDGCGLATWSRDGQDGEWTEPDAAQCESTVKPFDPIKYPTIGHHEFRCVRIDGHGEAHTNPEYTDWTDNSPHLVAPPKGTKGLVTCEVGPGTLGGSLSGMRLPGSIHLVRVGENSGSKEVLCGIDRFKTGFSIGGGTTPTDLYVCDTCRDRAHGLYSEFIIAGTHKALFAKQPAEATV